MTPKKSPTGEKSSRTTTPLNRNCFFKKSLNFNSSDYKSANTLRDSIRTSRDEKCAESNLIENASCPFPFRPITGICKRQSKSLNLKVSFNEEVDIINASPEICIFPRKILPKIRSNRIQSNKKIEIKYNYEELIAKIKPVSSFEKMTNQNCNWSYKEVAAFKNKNELKSYSKKTSYPFDIDEGGRPNDKFDTRDLKAELELIDSYSSNDDKVPLSPPDEDSNLDLRNSYQNKKLPKKRRSKSQEMFGDFKKLSANENNRFSSSTGESHFEKNKVAGTKDERRIEKTKNESKSFRKETKFLKLDKNNEDKKSRNKSVHSSFFSNRFSSFYENKMNDNITDCEEEDAGEGTLIGKKSKITSERKIKENISLEKKTTTIEDEFKTGNSKYDSNREKFDKNSLLKTPEKMKMKKHLEGRGVKFTYRDYPQTEKNLNEEDYFGGKERENDHKLNENVIFGEKTAPQNKKSRRKLEMDRICEKEVREENENKENIKKKDILKDFEKPEKFSIGTTIYKREETKNELKENGTEEEHVSNEIKNLQTIFKKESKIDNFFPKLKKMEFIPIKKARFHDFPIKKIVSNEIKSDGQKLNNETSSSSVIKGGEEENEGEKLNKMLFRNSKTFSLIENRLEEKLETNQFKSLEKEIEMMNLNENFPERPLKRKSFLDFKETPESTALAVISPKIRKFDSKPTRKKNRVLTRKTPFDHRRGCGALSSIIDVLDNEKYDSFDILGGSGLACELFEKLNREIDTI